MKTKKKLALIALVLCFFTNMVQAQEETEKWSVYGKFGLDFLIESASGNDNLSGVYAELGATYHLMPNIPLNFGLSYRTNKHNQSGANGAKTDIERLFVPVQIGYRFWLNDDRKISLTPRMGLYADWAVGGSSIVGGNRYKFKDYPNYNAFIVGGNIGLAVKLKETYGLFLEYGHGFIERFKNSSESYVSFGIGMDF